MNNDNIHNVKDPDPRAADHVTNKRYVDDNFLNKNGGLMFGTLSMNRNHLIGIPEIPRFQNSAVNRTYVANQLNSKLDKSANDD